MWNLCEGQAEEVQTQQRTRFLRLRVVDEERDLVNLRLPLSWINLLGKMVPERFLSGWEVNGRRYDLQDILDGLADPAPGRLLELSGDEGRTRLAITAE